MSKIDHHTPQAENRPPLTVRAQYIRDLSFENPNPLATFTSESEEQPDISVNVQANAQHVSDRNFEVTLDIKVDAKREKETMFIAELSYSAVVTIADDIAEKDVSALVMVDVPTLLFPFARNIIADATRDGGYPPLLLAPVDFGALFRQQVTANNERPSTVN